jgi:hypothetical protein
VDVCGDLWWKWDFVGGNWGLGCFWFGNLDRGYFFGIDFFGLV